MQSLRNRSAAEHFSWQTPTTFMDVLGGLKALSLKKKSLKEKQVSIHCSQFFPVKQSADKKTMHSLNCFFNNWDFADERMLLVYEMKTQNLNASKSMSRFF